jgi:hypothetical protein
MLKRAAAFGCLGMIALVAGCVSYATYPAVPQNTALNDPNTPAMSDVMLAGLRYVAVKYPPGGRPDPLTEPAPAPGPTFAVNLPPGISPKGYERIVGLVGNGAVALTPETSHLPIYHVTYMRVRGDQAQINILRPVTELPPTPKGMPVMQEIKLQLSGGLHPWKVITSREWDPGLEEWPELNYYKPAGEPVKAASRPESGVYSPRTKAKGATVGVETERKE